MSDPYAFFRLIQCILMPVNLGQDGSILELKFANQLQLPHPVGDTSLIQTELISRHKLKSLFYTLGTFLQHLQLLIAECHVVKEDKQVELVSSAHLKVNHVHYAVSLLQQVQCLLPLLSLDELNRRIIELT